MVQRQATVHQKAAGPESGASPEEDSTSSAGARPSSPAPATGGDLADKVLIKFGISRIAVPAGITAGKGLEMARAHMSLPPGELHMITYSTDAETKQPVAGHAVSKPRKARKLSREAVLGENTTCEIIPSEHGTKGRSGARSEAP